MKTYALSVSILILAVAIIAGMFMYNNVALSSVTFGNDYVSSHITTSGTSSPGCRYSIGSVVISDAGSAGSLYFHATTTIYATSTADEIFGLDGAAAEGTYTYDAAITAPLLIDSRGFNGDAVVTCR